MLSAISKRIIASRLMDIGVPEADAMQYIDSVIIDVNAFTDYNVMYDFIVTNYGYLVIG